MLDLRGGSRKSSVVELDVIIVAVLQKFFSKYRAGENMGVEVEDGLAGAGAVVDDQAVIAETIRLGGALGGQEQPAEEALIGVVGGGEAVEMAFGYDQPVHGGGGFDVFENVIGVVFVDFLGRDLSRGDFTEEAILMHGRAFAPAKTKERLRKEKGGETAIKLYDRGCSEPPYKLPNGKFGKP